MRITLQHQTNSLGWALHGAGCLAILVMLGGYYMLVTRPLNAQWDQHAQEVSSLRKFHSQASQVLATHGQLKAELQTMRETVGDTFRRLPESLEETEVMDEIKSIAENSGVSLEGYQMGLAEKLESHSKAELTLQCNGSFASICQFLDQINHFSRLTEVSRLEIETDSNLERYPLQVKFVLYFGASSHDKSMRGEVL